MNKRNARLAGLTFLLYFATSLSDGFLFAHASSGHGTAARLASIAQNVAQVRLTILLALLTVLYALILAVTLYALTREVDPELALIALTCRVVEGVINAVPVAARLGLLSIATASVTATASDATSLHTQAALLINSSWWSTTVGATIFSVGSALFAYLFLRGRTIPAPIAWFGLIASLLVIPVFPLSNIFPLSDALVFLTQIPLIIFELTLAFWLLIKGVKPQQPGTGDDQRSERDFGTHTVSQLRGT